MTAYYNEIDPQAAQWLRNLIDAGHIAPGVVDERSIEDVQPDEIASYTQCHFFAGIGVWSYALRLAGWPDDRPVWTGSCPCQPFSAAGKGAGFDDERHLWPAFHWLVEQCRPTILFGEQVAAKAVDDWLDVVSTDLEGLGFAVGSCAFPSAGVGAPHIRDRTYFMAYSDDARSQGRRRVHERAAERATGSHGLASGLAYADDCRHHAGERNIHARKSDNVGRGAAGVLADAADIGLDRRRSSETRDGRNAPRLESERLRDAGELADAVQSGRAERGSIAGCGQTAGRSGVSGLADAERERIWTRGCGSTRSAPGEMQGIDGERERVRIDAVANDDALPAPAGPTNGYWRDADWLLCRDEKWRSVEPGSFPLVDGAPSRVVRLRAYGNAINAQQAKTFIEVGMECLP